MQKKKPNRKKGGHSVKFTRRQILRSGVSSLPFVLAIPSAARAFALDEESMRPFREREAAFDKALRDRVAQLQKLPPGATNPPPKPQPPPRMTYNTTWQTSKNTTRTKATFSNNKSDDTEYETVYDGSQEDWKTDTR